MYEIIHAEIFNAVGQKRGSLLIGDFQNNFEEYKRLYKYDPYIHHNLMAENLVEKMAQVLREIHPKLGAEEFFTATKDTWRRGVIDPVFYKAMAWHGLSTTQEWQKLPKIDEYKKLQDLDNRLTKTCGK